MFNESTPVPLSRVVSAAMWVICWGFIAAAWIAFARNYADLGIMLMLSCLPFAWTAALLTIKEWARGLCRVVRVTSRGQVVEERQGSGGVRPGPVRMANTMANHPLRKPSI